MEFAWMAGGKKRKVKKEKIRRNERFNMHELNFHYEMLI